jgi:amidohydrolase
MNKSEIFRRAEKMYPLQIKWFHHLHRNPELANAEFVTTKFIKNELHHRGVEFLPLKMKTGAAAIINKKAKSGLALRADIDALPIDEKTKLPYKSQLPGRMHACGHDIHTAVAMGVSVILHDIAADIPGAVKVLFQPAEESPPGGAEQFLKEDILRNPKAEIIFALHTDPTLPTGRIGLINGPAMASVTDFDITIIGRGSHAAKPHLGVDAIVVAAELIGSLQKIVSREIDPLKPLVITIGAIRGGTARNIISDTVTIMGTARTLSPDTRKKIPTLLRRTIDGICRARGANYRLDITAGYPVLINNAGANQILADSYEKLFGKGKITASEQSMGGEDFALFLEKIPGAMFRLGVKNDKMGANKPWHSPEFAADPRSIYYGTAQMIMTVLDYFEK